MQADAVVYVIDDDEAVRELLSFLFKSAGLAARTYESATSFLNHLPQVKAGCIVTDVRMPGLSGLDLLRRLKELHSAVPVIVITGHGDVPLAVEAMKSGAADFLEKPFDDEALLAAVNVALHDQGASAKRDADRAGIIDRLATSTNSGAPGAGGPRGGPAQQDDRLRSRHQPANRGNLPRQRDVEDAGRKPLGPGAHGPDRRRARRGTESRAVEIARIGRPSRPLRTHRRPSKDLT